MKKRIKALVYTQGKFGKGFREIVDTENEYLYSWGRYPTKIKCEDLPDDYIRIHSRAIWYMIGYVKTSGIVDIDYTYCKENHLFKDDYIYISYKESLVHKKDNWGFDDIINYDVCVCGNDIIDIVLAAEKYSSIDTTKVRNKIEEKRIWLRDNEPDYYKQYIKEDCNIFDLWIKNGYIDEKLLKDKK